MEDCDDGWIRIPEDRFTGFGSRELRLRHSLTGQVYRVVVAEGDEGNFDIDIAFDGTAGAFGGTAGRIGVERAYIRGGTHRFMGLSWAETETPFARKNSWCVLTLTTPATLWVDDRLDHEVADAAPSLAEGGRAPAEGAR